MDAVDEDYPGMPIFPTVNEMVRELRLDLADWVNAESARFLKRSIYERTEQRVAYFPDHLLGARSFTCPEGHTVFPSWLTKRPPLQPFRAREGGLWRRRSVELVCEACGASFFIELPNVSPWLGEVSLYGDEAFRDIDTGSAAPRYCVTYSLVSRPILEEDDLRLIEQFIGLKRKHFGHSDRVHCKALFHCAGRRGGPTPEQVSTFIGEVADLIATFYGKVAVLNAVGVTYKSTQFKKREIEARKAQVFGTLIQLAIEELTKQGRSPRFFFERTDADGWAKNLFAGGRLTLMWPFITNGLPVRSPEFVPPTHSEYMELADIVSFAVADNIRNRAMEREGIAPPPGPRLDLARLGKVQYQGYAENGDALSQACVGYPWEVFFAGTPWA
ncbi:hypothetical protein [Ralstonia pseudosolanacearum]|uniref:hypothetical protein n=1 Tax=Ralstonia pseudosolanacearum TaxID=1310165 RepID=UPI001FF81F33|nr:hypothetical protein [Ralstonia pseudosolanacearum]